MFPNFSELLLEQSPGSYWVVDAEMTVRAAWGNCVPLFGRTGAEMAGCNLLDFVVPEQRGAWKDRVARVFAGETLFLREHRATGIHFITQFPVRAASGEIAFAAASSKDVTPWSTAEQELRQTVLAVLQSNEFERGRLARFLHDGVGQNLSAAGLKLDLLRMDLEPSSPQACAALAEVQHILEAVMEDVRDFSYELNPAMVERTGLHAALDRLAGRMRARFPGALRLKADPSIKIPPNKAVALFHIAQEAVQNAVQHAACTSIDIVVKSGRGRAALEVRDNGRGFDSGDVRACRRGLGLLSMEHYAAEAGLDLTIASKRGKGTVVRAAIAPPPENRDTQWPMTS